MLVTLFVPCFIDQLYPRTAFNVLKLLKRAGVQAAYNPEQTCCGQLAYNSGYWAQTRDLAIKFMRDFAGDSLIVSPSASCTGFVKNYYSTLFPAGTPEAVQCASLSERMFELTDFFVNHLKITDFQACFPHKVCYHDACSALREYGIRNEPRTLLANVNGLELIEMDETATCCGFGGTFAAKFHDISTAMTEQKVEYALKTGAEYIVSTESSCLMNIEGFIHRNKLPIKTIHIADILASGWPDEHS
ncbi:MAG: (Fe-S)-binding protein [Bacteroidales bacterium]|jgi:L-lactate dehydrogenase complex protein LldE|nr:(Fe-S)-binding protein [Bacteroidales bacterium]